MLGNVWLLKRKKELGIVGLIVVVSVVGLVCRIFLLRRICVERSMFVWMGVRFMSGRGFVLFVNGGFFWVLMGRVVRGLVRFLNVVTFLIFNVIVVMVTFFLIKIYILKLLSKLKLLLKNQTLF